MKKMTTAVLAMIILAGLVTGCGSKNDNKNASASKAKVDSVKIGYVDSGKSFPGDALGIAVEKGYIQEELNKFGVKAEFIPFVGAGPAINEALGSKSLDIGVYGDTPAILGKGSGIDTTLIGAGNTGLDAAIVVKPDSQINSVKDLKGKKVATMKGAYMHRTLIEALKANGLDIKDIEFFHMKAPEAEAALIAGKVEAIVAPNTSTARLVLDKNGRVLINCKDHPEWKGLNISLVRTPFAKENPEVVKAFVQGLTKAVAFAKSNPEETKQIWTKTGFSKEVFDYLYPDNQFNIEVELNEKVIKNLNYSKEFLLKSELLKDDFDINKWKDQSYLK